MSNEQKAVDVLAVMMDTLDYLDKCGAQGDIIKVEESLRDARAAIAELIRETTLMLEASPATASEREYYEARVRAALSRIGGAK